ncbi:uncharacterized protein FOMMEDRAFT_150608 [Fomitiporia mediterranea MF3/22]|uniref:uncharacterized protein n=1 Tax=Fomitiporia mediterranea (strain MF3/22) TaxID=694068 RepID=UPI00044093B5|nr:uncharacterized protein FOMMEDRAFT_150608 [Fomitiporia mediterranea MF3/22]EJD07985.1 hypothetical protein FOMMEDRAFT_150608 [Fomitiporia mediterranea MF3/22]
MSTHYSLHVIRAQDVLYKSFFHGNPSLYVVGPRDKDIVIAEIELRELIALCENGEAQINVHEKRNQTPSGKVLLRLKSINETEAVNQDLEGTRKATQGVRADAADSMAVAIADRVMQLSKAGDLYDSLEKLCETLDVFVKFINDVSKIHPYFSAAWQVATSVYKAVSKQFECDQKVVELVRSMEKAFTFARSTQDLKGKTRILELSIVELFKQIKACCKFIQNYVGHSFGGWMLDMGASKKIEEFMQVLARC